MRLHLLGIPHTQCTDQFTHCAFTNKVRTFPKMFASASAVRPPITYYGVGTPPPDVDSMSHILDTDLQQQLLGHRHENAQRFVGDDANWDSPLYRAFNEALGHRLIDTVSSGDLILLPFGPAHAPALNILRAARPNGQWLPVEMGIGYPNPYVAARVYESHAWMHFIAGKQGHEGSNYHTVIPPWYLPEEWATGHRRATTPTLAFVGRQTEQKGAHVVTALAKRFPDVRFECAGQGDYLPLHSLPNVEFHGAITGAERAVVYARAWGVLCPSEFIEPGCQVAMEAMVMGRVVFAPPRGCFPERIDHRVHGFLCRSWSDWVRHVTGVVNGSIWSGASEAVLTARAYELHHPHSIAPQYLRFFRHAETLLGDGWYHESPESTSSPRST